MVSPSEFPTVNIGQLKQKCDEARSNGKYLLVWDTNGQSTTYFQYMEHLTSVGHAKVQVALGANTAGNVL